MFGFSWRPLKKKCCESENLRLDKWIAPKMALFSPYFIFVWLVVQKITTFIFINIFLLIIFLQNYILTFFFRWSLFAIFFFIFCLISFNFWLVHLFTFFDYYYFHLFLKTINSFCWQYATKTKNFSKTIINDEPICPCQNKLTLPKKCWTAILKSGQHQVCLSVNSASTIKLWWRQKVVAASLVIQKRKHHVRASQSLWLMIVNFINAWNWANLKQNIPSASYHRMVNLS